VTATDPALDELYRDFADAGVMPLWTQREGLMPLAPQPAATARVWRWRDLYPIAERAGKLVPVGRGGERRAIALANPGLHGEPYATPTLWAAIQYLGPREVAPAHRHSQGAFRFVVEGEGVWTVVNGDPVAMRRGDLLLTPSWAFHEHHNPTDRPMAWLDGLDIPLVAALDAGFFDFGPDTITDTSTPDRSRGERLWAHPGVRPLAGIDATPAVSPLPAYRWQHTRPCGTTGTGRRRASRRDRTRPRGHPVRQPGERCGRPGQHAHRGTPADRRHRDAAHAHRGIVGVAGVLRAGHGVAG
jgi:gentisate 1,2-dioxygenase